MGARGPDDLWRIEKELNTCEQNFIELDTYHSWYSKKVLGAHTTVFRTKKCKNTVDRVNALDGYCGYDIRKTGWGCEWKVKVKSRPKTRTDSCSSLPLRF